MPAKSNVVGDGGPWDWPLVLPVARLFMQHPVVIMHDVGVVAKETCVGDEHIIARQALCPMGIPSTLGAWDSVTNPDYG